MKHKIISLEVSVRRRSTNERSKYTSAFGLVLKADSSQLAIVANCKYQKRNKEQRSKKREREREVRTICDIMVNSFRQIGLLARVAVRNGRTRG